MTKTRFVKRHRWVMVVLLLAVIVTGGIFMFSLNEKSKEERRNREYEISLVNALKNSYEGIEEIEITDPDFTMPPGAWSCDVTIVFEKKIVVSYRIGHSKEDIQNYSGSRQSDKDWMYLESHKGKTEKVISVTYSDKEEGEQ